jgi:hypothetical protein
MPYFAVQFDIDDGYAHVIENSEAFPQHFAKVSYLVYYYYYLFIFFCIFITYLKNITLKEVIGGILDLDPLEWRRPRKESFSVQSNKVIEFLKWWKDYDFNKSN